jgi:hypothetical protein
MVGKAAKKRDFDLRCRSQKKNILRQANTSTVRLQNSGYKERKRKRRQRRWCRLTRGHHHRQDMFSGGVGEPSVMSLGVTLAAPQLKRGHGMEGLCLPSGPAVGNSNMVGGLLLPHPASIDHITLFLSLFCSLTSLSCRQRELNAEIVAYWRYEGDDATLGANPAKPSTYWAGFAKELGALWPWKNLDTRLTRDASDRHGCG